MKKNFSRNLIVVGSVHIILVFGLTTLALVQGCRRAHPVALTYLPIEFVTELPDTRSIIPNVAPAQPKQATKKTPVRKPPDKTPRQKSRRVSQSEIEKMLDLNPSKTTTLRSFKDDTMYRTLIDQAYRRAWKQPSYSEVGDAITLVSVYLRDDGSLIKYDLQESGNELLDSSVRAALEAVVRIPGLSSEYIARHKVIPIKFQVEK